MCAATAGARAAIGVPQGDPDRPIVRRWIPSWCLFECQGLSFGRSIGYSRSKPATAGSPSRRLLPCAAPRAPSSLLSLNLPSLAPGAPLAHAALASVQPLHVFAWIVDSGLKDSLKSLAHALLRRVDRHSWRWPRQRGARGGVTVAELADGAGLSRRHAARCLRDLEDLGLVRTTFRPFEVSEYALLPQAWKALATRHQAQRDARRARHRSDRIDATRRGRPPGCPAGSSKYPEDVQHAEDAPRRLLRPMGSTQSRRLGAPAEALFSVVGGAAAAILGQGLHRGPRRNRTPCPPALDAATARSRCACLRAGTGRALGAGVGHPDALRLRGLGPRGSGVDARRMHASSAADPVLGRLRLAISARESDGRTHRRSRVGVPDTRAWVPSGLATGSCHNPPTQNKPGGGHSRRCAHSAPSGRDLEAFLKP